MKIWKMIIINLFGLLFTVAFLAALLFPAAGSFKWINGWIFIGTLVGYIIFYMAFFLITDPATLERRSKMSKEKGDSIYLILLGILFLAILILPALDFRFGLSRIPLPVSFTGTIILLSSYAILFSANRQNTFASKGLRIHENQKVISTGLYGIVRHPLYLGGVLMGFGIPLALGSILAMAPALFMPFVFAGRIKKEENMLLRELDGYDDYRSKVKYRLFPFLW